MLGVLAIDARESRSEVEAEAVDTHFLVPVAQAVHYHAQHIRMAKFECVSGTRKIAVVPLHPGRQIVIRLVVDSPKTEGRPRLVALGSMIIDNIKNNLDAGVVHLLYERLEPAEPLCSEIFGMRCEEPDRVIAPVVAQAVLDQMVVMDESMDRQKLDRRDAEVAQIGYDRCRREACEGATYGIADLRVAHREPFGVHFIDDGFVPRTLIRPPSPGKGRVNDPAFRNERRTVPIVEGQILRVVAYPVAEQGVIPFKRTDKCFGIGVDEQLMVVEAVARLGFVRSVYPIAIKLTGPHVRQVAMPDLMRVFR